MASTDRIDTFPLMLFTAKCCKLCGLWFDKNYRKLTWQPLFVIFLLIFWYIIPSVAFIIGKTGSSFIVLMKPILELFAMLVFGLRILNHVLNLEIISMCYLDLQQAFDQFAGLLHEDVRSVLRHAERSTQYLAKIYFGMVYIQASTYGLVPLITTILGYSFGNDEVELPSTLLEADFILFDQFVSFWVWLPTMVTSIMIQYCMLTLMSSNECLFWNLLHHVSCLFKVVQLEIARLNDYKDPDEFRNQLALITEIHELCFRCARRLETVLSPIMALLYCSCIFQTCYLMFIVSVIDDVFLLASMVFVLQYTVFLIFAFSMLGTELMEESASISTAIYNTQWYERPAAERRLLLFIQMRSNRVVAISAAKFFHLTRSTFGRAMRTAFSFFTIMQQFYEEDGGGNVDS